MYISNKRNGLCVYSILMSTVLLNIRLTSISVKKLHRRSTTQHISCYKRDGMHKQVAMSIEYLKIVNSLKNLFIYAFIAFCNRKKVHAHFLVLRRYEEEKNYIILTQPGLLAQSEHPGAAKHRFIPHNTMYQLCCLTRVSQHIVSVKPSSLLHCSTNLFTVMKLENRQLT